MKQELARAQVDEAIGIYVQKLDFECNGLKVLNCQLVRSGEGNAASRAEWLEQYKTAFSARQIAMDELIYALLPDYADGETQFYLDYRTFELVAFREVQYAELAAE